MKAIANQPNLVEQVTQAADFMAERLRDALRPRSA